MRFPTASSPFIHGGAAVDRVMLHVLAALVPGTLAMFWYFGWGVLYNILICTAVSVAAEAAVLALRRRPARPVLGDLSVLVTAWLLGLALPPLAPWWLPTAGSLFAVVVAKHLFGGLGYNPFNPAMAGYVLLIVSFPTEMTHWIAPSVLAEVRLGPIEALRHVFTGALPEGIGWDALASATPLDTMRTQLLMNRTIDEIRASPLWGDFGGRGWEWIGNWYLLGGLWLVWRRVADWRIPAGFLGALILISTVFYLADPDTHPFPAFHVFSGGAILGAFFIATDPVTAASTPRGRWIYGAGAGVLTFVIRAWGGYPDGVAFSVLLMNMAAPTIDYFTRPRAYGHRAPGDLEP
jgi:electron transport complex protein RnfD